MTTQSFEAGDEVGIKEPNLYTGVGVVKEKDVGVFVEYLGDLPNLAFVDFASKSNFHNPTGRVILFVRDLERRNVLAPDKEGSKDGTPL